MTSPDNNFVRFRTATGEYAIAIGHARDVRTASKLIPLPSPGPGVVGVLPHSGEAVTVVDVLGRGDQHVLVLSVGGGSFGVLVEEVVGVVSIDQRQVGPPPSGQTRPFVTGVVHGEDGLLLIVDGFALARVLDGPADGG